MAMGARLRFKLTKVYVVIDIDEADPWGVFASKEDAENFAKSLDPDGRYVYGVMSRLRAKVRQGKGGRVTLAFLESVLLNDPCVYCQEFGCDSVDHITPIALIDQLNTGFGKSHWTNLAPCHKTCNKKKGGKGLIYGLMA
jgi:hypothetical protein